MTTRETLAALLVELRAMRPSTDVNRLSLSRQHREDELGKLAYRRAISDACAGGSPPWTPPSPPRKASGAGRWRR